MEELHDHDRATIDHTTLLLNCYAKLKDTEKLEAFINSGSNFDFETAISMCRQGGYHDQAVFLARKHGEHNIVIDILIEDSKKYEDALEYIWRLDPDLAYSNMMRYARVLLEHCPENAARMFIDYYTGEYRPKKEQSMITVAAPSQGGSIGLAAFASLNPLSYRQAASPATVGNQPLNEMEGGENEEPPLEYGIPKPRTAFSAFVDHPEEFIVFLEACVKQDHVGDQDKVDLYTTLFEMYLDAASRNSGSEKLQWESKARKLIDDKQVGIRNGRRHS